MNMHSVKANCDIQSLCVPFPAGQWGSHNKQQPKKVLPRKLLPKPEEDEKKEGSATKRDGQNQREFMTILFAGAEMKGKGWSGVLKNTGSKQERKKRKKEPKWAGEEGT